MSFVAWLVLPVAVTMIATVIMLIAGRRPHTDTHQDIESFARFRGALERQTVSDESDSSSSDRSAHISRSSQASRSSGR